jgi:hypothetical protein
MAQIIVTLSSDPCSFGEINLSELGEIKAAWKSRVEDHLQYLSDEGHEVEVEYGSRTRVSVNDSIENLGNAGALEHAIRIELDACWEAWCADGCTV